jgi:hypothetical protein
VKSIVDVEVDRL